MPTRSDDLDLVVFVANTLYYLLSYPPSGFDFGLGAGAYFRWRLAQRCP